MRAPSLTILAAAVILAGCGSSTHRPVSARSLGLWSGQQQETFFSACEQNGGSEQLCYCKLTRAVEASPPGNDTWLIDRGVSAATDGKPCS